LRCLGWRQIASGRTGWGHTCGVPVQAIATISGEIAIGEFGQKGTEMTEPATILLIEDDREIQSTLRSVLESAGYIVLVAPNGIEGKKLIVSRTPDVVITDMMMPQLGGFPVLEFLRQEVENPPRVIMITANEGGRHKAYAEMLGVDDYLRKPFAMDVMLESVASSLAKAAALKAQQEEAAKPKRIPRKKAVKSDEGDE